MTDQREPDNPAAYALARYIADHPISTVQAAFRYLNMQLTLEAREQSDEATGPVLCPDCRRVHPGEDYCTEPADRPEVEAHRLALSQALGLGTSAPWEAIHERAAELHRGAVKRQQMAAAVTERFMPQGEA